MATVPFDLGLEAVTEPTVLLAPLSSPFVVELKNVAPGGSHHVTYDWFQSSEPTETRFSPPASALHRDYDLLKIPLTPYPPLHDSPACDELQALVDEVLKARDEAELKGRRAAFQDKFQAALCPRLSHVDAQVRAVTESSLVPYYTLQPSDELRFTVQRLDPATRAPLKTWRFVVRPSAPRLDWTYPNEEAWIVAEVARDVAEMIAYSRNRSLPSEKELALAVTLETGTGNEVISYAVSLAPRLGGSFRISLRFPDHIWAPPSYEPLAVGLIGSSRARAADRTDETGLLQALLDPRTAVLERESRRISTNLEKSMLDPGAHEEAALVLGTLALREEAGPFSDSRQTLCRMAAHLAVARALRRGVEPPLAGLGDALLQTLANRERAALTRIEALGTANSTRPWTAFLRALRIRNTRDWRILGAGAEATLLERLEQYRALARSVGSSQVLQYFDTFRPEPLTDWARIAFAEGESVEQGHRLSSSVVGLEIKEASDTWEALYGSAAPPDQVVGHLNAQPERLVTREPGGTARPRVIGWGAWSRLFQRNLCFEARATVRFLEQSLGLKDEAGLLRTALAGQLSTLDLWPVVASRWANSEAVRDMRAGLAAKSWKSSRAETCPRAVELIQKTPELVTVGSWSNLDNPCAEERDHHLIPPLRHWFNRAAPLGTALIDDARILVLPPVREDRRKAFAAFHVIAPFDAFVLKILAPEEEVKTFEQLHEFYGPLAEFDLAAMRRLAGARRDDPAAYRAWYEKIAAIEPASYITLAEYLVEIDLEDEAAEAFEKGLAGARDRVMLSNRVLWLVGYYCDRGRLSRAREVAAEAAEVYSSGGLDAMAYLMERTGDYVGAEQWYQKVVERYDDRRDLDQFYVRYDHRVGDGRFGKEATQAMARVFPSGLERVSLAELSAPPGPADEVKISGRYPKSARFGLQKDDVVVALNGFRVHTDAQYQCLWTFEDDSVESAVIVWRAGRYREIRGHLKRVRYTPVSTAS